MLRDGLRALIIKTGRNRRSLRSLYYIWRSMPYPLRKLATALFIITVLSQKKLFRVDRQNDLTPLHKLGTLSFWGVPPLDLKDYRLRLEGAVRQLEEDNRSYSLRMESNSAILNAATERCTLPVLSFPSLTLSPQFLCSGDHLEVEIAQLQREVERKSEETLG